MTSLSGVVFSWPALLSAPERGELCLAGVERDIAPFVHALPAVHHRHAQPRGPRGFPFRDRRRAREAPSSSSSSAAPAHLLLAKDRRRETRNPGSPAANAVDDSGAHAAHRLIAFVQYPRLSPSAARSSRCARPIRRALCQPFRARSSSGLHHSAGKVHTRPRASASSTSCARPCVVQRPGRWP